MKKKNILWQSNIFYGLLARFNFNKSKNYIYNLNIFYLRLFRIFYALSATERSDNSKYTQLKYKKKK